MSKTYRRFTKKSQNRTVTFIKDLYHEASHQNFEGDYFLINGKGKNRFFTDNQKTYNWSSVYKQMNKKARLEAKNKLSKIHNAHDGEELLLKYYRGKHSFAIEIYLYGY